MPAPPNLPTTLRATFAALLPPGSRVVVATSGGPDSQALLHLAAQLQHDLGWGALWAVGIDHQLRPEARDELALAAALALAQGVPFTQIAVDVDLAGNLLAAARQARYTALRSFARQHAATAIAVAHTATDQTETVLQRLCRGTGLRGAAGIRPRRGLLVRPLLDVSRASIEAYVAEQALPVARDPSNGDLQRSRARLRATVLPALSTLNRQAERHFAAFAARAQQDDAYLTQQARRRFKRALQPLGELDLQVLRASPAAVGSRILALWLRRHGVQASATLIESLWQARGSERLLIGRRPRAFIIERDRLWCVTGSGPQSDEAAIVRLQHDLPIPGKMVLPTLGRALVSREIISRSACLSHFRRADAESVAFDADRLHFGLKVRSWRVGDKLRPFGLNGHTKVSDLFTDAKVPRALRRFWPVVTAGESIVWVVGLRRSDDAPVNAETRRIIQLKLNEKLDGALLGSAC